MKVEEGKCMTLHTKKEIVQAMIAEKHTNGLIIMICPQYYAYKKRCGISQALDVALHMEWLEM